MLGSTRKYATQNVDFYTLLLLLHTTITTNPAVPCVVRPASRRRNRSSPPLYAKRRTKSNPCMPPAH
uniref:Putative secreted peptide n=1 Tax=Anopheles braziliensis TaxID=58242 RepID=A0A2M3ZXF8_9DIPT